MFNHIKTQENRQEKLIRLLAAETITKWKITAWRLGIFYLIVTDISGFLIEKFWNTQATGVFFLLYCDSFSSTDFSHHGKYQLL